MRFGRESVVSVCPWWSFEQNGVIIRNVLIHTSGNIRLKGTWLRLWNAPRAPRPFQPCSTPVSWIKLSLLPFNVKVTLVSLCNSVLRALTNRGDDCVLEEKAFICALWPMASILTFQGGVCLEWLMTQASKSRAPTLTWGFWIYFIIAVIIILHHVTHKGF